MNAYESERFVPAFHNFFFIIEDLFADGKFHENAVVEAFGKSDLMRQVLREVIDQINDDPSHQTDFVAMFNRESLLSP